MKQLANANPRPFFAFRVHPFEAQSHNNQSLVEGVKTLQNVPYLHLPGLDRANPQKSAEVALFPFKPKITRQKQFFHKHLDLVKLERPCGPSNVHLGFGHVAKFFAHLPQAGQTRQAVDNFAVVAPQLTRVGIHYKTYTQ